MSKINQIQKALMSIDQASFQKLCDSYLHRTLDIKEINPVGSVEGENKTRTGQPDTLITLNNGKYVFVEATTEKNNLLNKFSADLDECFNEAKTGVVITDVEKIILACNRKLSHKDKTTLLKKGQDNNCIVEFLDLNTISFDLYKKFQTLAKEFLGIELDTGQILSPIDFIKDYQKSKLATPLDNEFFFREAEIEKILEALNTYDLIIISGRSGVGKTKLALECVKQFIKVNSNFQPFCIYSKNLDIYENLKAYFGNDGSYLVIVDDANRLSDLSHILRLIYEQTDSRKIKIILTVRDYALNQVRNTANDYHSSEIELQKFSHEEITKILEGFGIKNHNYIYRIYEISGGNPRLAIMTAMVAIEKNTLDSIRDVSDLYEIYFDSINEKLEELNNKNLFQIAGIISFFRALDKTNTEFFEGVAQSFGLTADELWIGLEDLHNLEIVDMSFKVAKISDQTLGTYLFYKAFFKDEVLDFSILLSNYSEHFPYRVFEALKSVLTTFKTDFIIEKLRPHVDSRWVEIKDDETKALSFIEFFYYLKETEFLFYLKKQIYSLDEVKVKESELQFAPRNYEPIDDKYLKLLKLFQGENIKLVFDLLFYYLERNLNLLPQVIYLLTHDFYFNHKSNLFSFYVQQCLISKLIEKSKEEKFEFYKKIFLKFSEKFAKLLIDQTSPIDLPIKTPQISISPSEALVLMREKMWERLIEIYYEGNYQPEIFKIINNYSRQISHKNYADNEVIYKDVEILLPFITSQNPEKFQDCVLANNFFDFLENVEMNFDESLRTTFTNKTFEISRVLLDSDNERWKIGYEEYDQLHQQRLDSYFEIYKLADYKELFEHYEEIRKYQDEQGLIQMTFSLARVLINTAQKTPKLFIKVIKYLFESGNNLYLYHNNVVYWIIEKSSSQLNAYEQINEFDFNLRSKWLFDYFQLLKVDSINEYFLSELYELYKSADLNEIPSQFEYLTNYSHLDANIITKVIKILFERVKNNEGHFSFHYVLNFGDISKRLDVLFANELPIVKEIFLFQNNNERYSDYKSRALKQIFKLDNNFLFEYLDHLIKEKASFEVLRDGNTDFSFIWEHDDYKDLFNSLLDFTYEKEKGDSFFRTPSFIELTFRGLNEEQKDKDKQKIKDKLKERALTSLKQVLKENAKDKRKASHIFQLIVNCFGDKKKEFLEIFLKENKNFEDFKWLDFQTNHVVIADMGSRIPRLESWIKFYESLLPLFNSIDLVEHKLSIDERITYYKQSIEDARKSDFIGHY
jgi:hypothetical protein